MIEVFFVSLIFTTLALLILSGIRIEVAYKYEMKALDLVHYTAKELIKQRREDFMAPYDILDEYDEKVGSNAILFIFSVWSFDAFYPGLVEKLTKLQERGNKCQSE
jgi:hypothetical protein